MTHSTLVSYTNISPNKSKRTAKIDTITIHIMGGDMTIENCGNLFSKVSTNASSNYGIGSDGRIGCYVPEDYRSYCSSNRNNDNRAITIEVANIGGKVTGYKITDKAMNSLIELLVDVCKRNGINALLWKADKTLIGKIDKQNMTVHRWFANKDCPGDYLYSKLGYVADKVTKRLNETNNSSYKVKICTNVLNVRKMPSINSEVVGQIRDRGVYTIVDSVVDKNMTWLKLKSGVGWICSTYTTRL